MEISKCIGWCNKFCSAEIVNDEYKLAAMAKPMNNLKLPIKRIISTIWTYFFFQNIYETSRIEIDLEYCSNSFVMAAVDFFNKC